MVVDPELRPHAPHEPHQRLRLGLRARARARGSTSRARPVRQRQGKLRLRSTPRAFCRVSGRAPVRVAGAHEPERDAVDALRRRSAATIASPGRLVAVHVADDEHVHAARPPRPTRVARISRPCDRVADDERGERGGERAPMRVVASSAMAAGRDRRRGDVRGVAGVAAGRPRRRGRAGRPVRARRRARDVGRRDAADPLLARRGRRLRGDGAARADAVARARGRVRRGPADASAA